ncbi:hypothetical protein [Devosia sediminis]|uniref:Uncharacterized protein n=1 Tax=Devosia sediminis TaxID=2798801 RepID=A0A934ILS5_9HYPH|nr:hypothetical protein [Devosia sediminis]MBJ3783099.1 hypothetical protein [Devosia sediminis]
MARGDLGAGQHGLCIVAKRRVVEAAVIAGAPPLPLAGRMARAGTREDRGKDQVL